MSKWFEVAPGIANKKFLSIVHHPTRVLITAFAESYDLLYATQLEPVVNERGLSAEQVEVRLNVLQINDEEWVGKPYPGREGA